MVLAYTWNASRIDGTDIVRSVPTVGRELKVPLDIDLMKLSTVVDKASDSISA